MKLACLGPQGAFTEQAAFTYDSTAEIICCPTIEDSIFLIESGEADEAIVPIENSIEGSVNATLDYLIFGTGLYIKAQINLPIIQNFLVKKDFKSDEKIKSIYSHPQALAQSRKFTNENYHSVPTLETSSTAEAARLISMAKENYAAIGSARTAQIYDLKILHSSIQQTKNNVTSFVVITKKNTSAPKLENKTSIAFSTENKPGELYKILNIFALWDLNMVKIVSRPMKESPGEYVFLIDIENYDNIDDVKDALIMIKRKSIFYKNLGTYPVNYATSKKN